MKLRLFAWLILVAGMAFSRGAYIEDAIYNIDEAEYGVAADALTHGWLPGVDLLGSTKPPGIAVIYQLLFEGFGRSLAVIHAAHLILIIAAGIILIELAISLWGLAAAIPTAFLFWIWCNSFSLPAEMLALNVESPGILFMLLGLWLVWKWPASLWVVSLAGIALGIATLFRQSLVPFLIPALVVAYIRDVRRRGFVASIVIGFLLPWTAVLFVYARAGGLAWAWDSWVRYPITYAGDLGIVGFLSALYLNGVEFVQQCFVPLGMAIWGGAILWREKRTPRVVFLGTLLVVSLIALSSGSRFYGHYFIQVFPALTLLGVPAWIALPSLSRKTRILSRSLLAVGAFLALFHFPLLHQLDRGGRPPRSLYSIGETQDEYEIAGFVRENTEPEETIAVWGYCPQIYYLSNRLPGVRDYLCHYTTGYSPGSFDPSMERSHRSFGHPQAEKMFVEDLMAREPKYIFDLVQRQDYIFPFSQFSIRYYFEISEYLRTNYLPEGDIKGIYVYRRRTAEDTWWPETKDLE
jgi:4-amino-4-deoxy-L-arabinose transferase-like glycosyltransferase